MPSKKILAIGLFIMTTTTINTYGNIVDDIKENTNFSIEQPHGIKIDLYCEYERPVVISDPRDRTPIQIPSIYMDGHIIYLNGYAFEEIQLITLGKSHIVYSSVICDGEETIEIPNNITGEYEIRLYHNGYYFYGEVEL